MSCEYVLAERLKAPQQHSCAILSDTATTLACPSNACHILQPNTVIISQPCYLVFISISCVFGFKPDSFFAAKNVTKGESGWGHGHTWCSLCVIYCPKPWQRSVEFKEICNEKFLIQRPKASVEPYLLLLSLLHAINTYIRHIIHIAGCSIKTRGFHFLSSCLCRWKQWQIDNSLFVLMRITGLLQALCVLLWFTFSLLIPMIAMPYYKHCRWAKHKWDIIILINVPHSACGS